MAKIKRDSSLFMGMTGSERKLLSFEIFFPPKWWWLCFFLPKSDRIMLKCWINLRLSQETWEFFRINKTWKVTYSSSPMRWHWNEIFILDSLIFHAWMFLTRGPRGRISMEFLQYPGKTAVSPRFSLLEMFHEEERLRLSDRNSILMT